MGELVMSPTENKAVQRVQMSRLQCRKYVQRSMKMFRHSEMKVCLWRPERSIVWRRTTLEGAVVTEGITHHQGLCINAGQPAAAPVCPAPPRRPAAARPARYSRRSFSIPARRGLSPSAAGKSCPKNDSIHHLPTWLHALSCRRRPLLRNSIVVFL